MDLNEAFLSTERRRLNRLRQLIFKNELVEGLLS